MDAEIRRRFEMGIRALEFSKAHPDPSAGYATAVARLEERLNQAHTLLAVQRAGTIEQSQAVAMKAKLRRFMRRSILRHVAQVAAVASKEEPELVQKFQFPTRNTNYLVFLNAAEGIAREAQARKELLIRHGLAEPVLDSLVQTLEQLNGVSEQGIAAHRTHVGAGAELVIVLRDAAQLVRVLDGLNRYRFRDDALALAEWQSATNVLGPMHFSVVEGPKPEEQKPAA